MTKKSTISEKVIKIIKIDNDYLFKYNGTHDYLTRNDLLELHAILSKMLKVK